MISSHDSVIGMFHCLFISVDEQYANLKNLAAERRKKLLEALAQFQLNREAYIIDTWIKERV